MSETAALTTAGVRLEPQAKQQATRLLWQMHSMPGGHRQPYLYSILDAARDERIYPGLRRLAATEEIICLYQGPTATELATVAPYLVCLGTGDRVFNWLWDEGWGESWGIFVWSLVSPQQLRTHFRRLTMVSTEGGQRLLFRFYDPRVLRDFLPTCDASQCQELFGPVTRFAYEAEFGRAVVLSTVLAGRPVIREMPITARR